jgi:hypothetical protein
MQAFDSFLAQILRKEKEVLGKNICFVYQQSEPVRLQEFICVLYRIHFFQKIAPTTLTYEGESPNYDLPDQLSVFVAPEAALVHTAASWLQDFSLARSDEVGFLTLSQKQALFIQLKELLLSTTKHYFFEASAKDAQLLQESLGASVQVLFIKVPEQLSIEVFSLCAQAVGFSSSIPLEEIFTLSFQMSLDSALILFDHVACLSRRTWESSKGYLFGLLSDVNELRDLSEAFWTRNQKRFFLEWNKISADYSENFWISYWSNQVFLAYFYIDRASSGQKITPQGQEHSLSPTFTWKNGWKKYSKSYCFILHKILFEVDSELKKGSAESILEYFLTTHFLGNR